jgi:hypothetical protein
MKGGHKMSNALKQFAFSNSAEKETAEKAMSDYELETIDSLWYFITKNGNWILGSG